MRILVACEFSGIVREAFRARGHEAISCDLEPSELPGPHIIGDVRELLGESWEMLIAFPPCTYLASSGARWWPGRKREQEEALAFVRLLLGQSHIPRIALENPVGRIATVMRRADQIIQPWQFGHGETKATCLWLKGLAPLKPTKIVEGREQKCWRASSKERAKNRSRTYSGIAAAMAEQWGAAP